MGWYVEWAEVTLSGNVELRRENLKENLKRLVKAIAFVLETIHPQKSSI